MSNSTRTSGLLALLLLTACFENAPTLTSEEGETSSGMDSTGDGGETDAGETGMNPMPDMGDGSTTGDGDGDGDGDTSTTGDTDGTTTGDGDGDDPLLLGDNCHPLGDPTCADGLTCAFVGWDGQFNQWECVQKTGQFGGFYTDPCLDESDCALGYSCREKNETPTPVPDCGSSRCCIAYCFDDNDCPNNTFCEDYIPNNAGLPPYIEDEGGIRHCGVP